MEENKGWLAFAEAAEPELLTEIVENGIRYNVDGEERSENRLFFLDQKYNRLPLLRSPVVGHVLDCFTHVGCVCP